MDPILNNFINCKKCNKVFDEPYIIINCGHFICGSCLKISKECFTCKGRIGSTTIVQELKQQIENINKVKNTSVFCKSHKSEATRICLDCQIPLCKLCEKSNVHQGHKTISDEKEEFETIWLQLREEAKALEELLDQRIGEKSKFISKYNDIVSNTKLEFEKLKSFFQSLRNFIDIKEEETISATLSKHQTMNSESLNKCNDEYQDIMIPAEQFLKELTSSSTLQDMHPSAIYSMRFYIVNQYYLCRHYQELLKKPSAAEISDLSKFIFVHEPLPVVTDQIDAIILSSILAENKKLPRSDILPPISSKSTSDKPGRYIYSLGRSPIDEEDDTELFEFMDLDQGEWIATPVGNSLPSIKTFQSMVCTNSFLYIFGGLNFENNYFKLDLKKREIAKTGKITTGGGSNIAAIYDGKDHIYLFGGVDTTIDCSTYISRITRFNINDDSFEVVAHLEHPRAFITPCFDGDSSIYLLGGYNVNSYYKRVEIFDIKTLKSTFMPFKTSALCGTYVKSNHSLYIFNDKLKFIRVNLSNNRQTYITGPLGVSMNYLQFVYLIHDKDDSLILVHKKSAYKFSVSSNKWTSVVENNKNNKVDYYAITLSYP